MPLDLNVTRFRGSEYHNKGDANMSITVTKLYHQYCPQCPAVDRWLPSTCTDARVGMRTMNVMEPHGQAFAARFDIQSVPTLVIERDGTVVGVLSGTHVSPSALLAALDRLREPVAA
jgi:thioredoxin-like negative regulator of GroEL